jgi:hypothetical protein
MKSVRVEAGRRMIGRRAPEGWGARPSPGGRVERTDAEWRDRL